MGFQGSDQRGAAVELPHLQAHGALFRQQHTSIPSPASVFGTTGRNGVVYQSGNLLLNNLCSLHLMDPEAMDPEQESNMVGGQICCLHNVML